MMIFSAAKAAFYDPELRAAYEGAGNWPDDGIEVSDEVFQECLAARQAGKVIVGGAGGAPLIQDPPPLSTAELTRIVLAERDQKLAAAAVAIAPLQDAVDLGMADDAEKAALTAWKQYRVALNRIQQQAGYPGAVNWPAAPAQS